ncbi:alpha/beta fold hydrolase [Sediminibacterium sp.]|uniref:alpha/beta fold hydrolase n=1 Tax=Sediminibacterium sp. TaxID=1917865 RepID=UPI0027158EE0|nr:alpha/beta hydrolase [Sediminibacterium sp.]MDO9000581.1 alpha/beta hydrolase [Bacteroidota bacterium]MDP3146851.1 alpha/beta hydrolase [Bacteroidota bacterium]MDP3567603.1 alpha/beta hydrolase [Sediminibacterium sp.]
MKCKTADDLSIYYEVQGNLESSETIVLLNGLTQSTVSWFFVLQHLKEKYKIILLDFIFQGQSDKAEHWRDFDQHANDVKHVLQHEKITKANIIGLSYGSLVAQNFAVNYPTFVNKLILISTFAHKTPYYEAVELGWWRALEMGGYNLMLDIMLPSVLSEDYFSNPIIPINLMKEARLDAQQNKQAIFNLMQATKDRKDYRKELEKITAPTLIIQGEKDLLLPVHLAEEVHKHIKNSKIKVIKNAGHTLNLEHVPEVCGDIKEFLL